MPWDIEVRRVFFRRIFIVVQYSSDCARVGTSCCRSTCYSNLGFNPGLHADGRELVVRGARAVFGRKGEDVVLNCSLESPVPATGIEEVTWKKTDRDILVLLYQENKTFPESSHERYRGRVDLFASEIPKGNVSLKLMGVQMEDKGEFVCEVHVGNVSARTPVVLQGVGNKTLRNHPPIGFHSDRISTKC